MLQYYFSIRQFRLIKRSFFIHSTTPYIHPRIDSRIEPKLSDCAHACTLTICMLVIFYDLCRQLTFFLKTVFFKKNIFGSTIRVSNGPDPDLSALI